MSDFRVNKKWVTRRKRGMGSEGIDMKIRISQRIAREG